VALVVAVPEAHIQIMDIAAMVAAVVAAALGLAEVVEAVAALMPVFLGAAVVEPPEEVSIKVATVVAAVPEDLMARVVAVVVGHMAAVVVAENLLLQAEQVLVVL